MPSLILYSWETIWFSLALPSSFVAAIQKASTLSIFEVVLCACNGLACVLPNRAVDPHHDNVLVSVRSLDVVFFTHLLVAVVDASSCLDAGDFDDAIHLLDAG